MSSNTFYSAYAFLGFVLVLTPLPWHLQAWNSGTCLFMVWIALGCLMHFFNSIVWANSVEIHSFIYGDIASKLIVGLSIGIPCSILCISRRLFLIAAVSKVSNTPSEKRVAIMIDLAIGVGFPMLIMALHYIVQGHRFDIYEGFGPWPSIVDMWPSYIVIWMWPIIIGLISLTYSARSLYIFLRRRLEFQQYLSSNRSGMSMNRYFRLMALAMVDITMLTPLSIYFMVLNLQLPISPWISWSDTKFDFSRVDIIPTILIDLDPTVRISLLLNVWIVPTCGIIFFLFFGIAEESRGNYKQLAIRILSLLRIKLPTKKRPAILPIVINVKQDLSSESNFKLSRASLSRSSLSHEPKTEEGTDPVPTGVSAACSTDINRLSLHTPQTASSNPFSASSYGDLEPPSPAAVSINRRGSDDSDLGISVSDPIARPPHELCPLAEQNIFDTEIPRTPDAASIV